jgi:hypothetical protein
MANNLGCIHQGGARNSLNAGARETWDMLISRGTNVGSGHAEVEVLACRERSGDLVRGVLRPREVKQTMSEVRTS